MMKRSLLTGLALGALGAAAAVSNVIGATTVANAAGGARDHINRKRLAKVQFTGAVLTTLDRDEHNARVDLKKADKRAKQAARKRTKKCVEIVAKDLDKIPMTIVKKERK